MEYRTIQIDYCIFKTGKNLKENKTEYTIQVPATTFSAGFIFVIWINDEDDMKKHEIIKKHIMEQMALEHNTVRCLRQDLYDAEEELSNAAEEYTNLKNELKEAVCNTEYYRQKYLDKVSENEAQKEQIGNLLQSIKEPPQREIIAMKINNGMKARHALETIRDLTAKLQVEKNNTEYFKKKLREKEASLMEYAERENHSKAFEKEQSEAINALRNQILELKKPNYPFSFVRHVRLKEIELEITYRMEYTKLKNDYFYHFIIEDDQVSYVPQIFFYQSQRDDEAAIEYAQNILNNEATLYIKLRIQDDTIAKQKEHIKSLEKIVADYRKKAQGNY